MPQETLTNCPHCQAPLPPGALVCTACRHLVYEARLKELLENAQRLETVDPMFAAGLLRQAMALVPPGSQPHQILSAQVEALSRSAFGGAGRASGGPRTLNYAPAEAKSDAPAMAIAKTGGSMALSIFVYYATLGAGLPARYRWEFAIGLVGLLLVHELGHVIANWYYGLKQSPPIFIPYMGAVIFLRSNPPDAKAEAVVGIAGPVAGTLGAVGCFLFAGFHDDRILARVAEFALAMNLFNMIPCPPLDGGRIAAAISPFLWIPGVIAFVAVVFRLGGAQISWVTILMGVWILQSALPRVIQVLFKGGRQATYYKLLPLERLATTVSYLLLSLLLAAILWGPDLIMRYSL